MDSQRASAHLKKTVNLRSGNAGERIASSALRAKAGADVDQVREDLAISHGIGANNPWTRSEIQGRYGYAARLHHAEFADWSPELEAILNDEWQRLGAGQSWEEARDGIRRGWDAASQQLH